ncbi:alpha/beta fold hydrolase (macronuclear) [Tetrahymena thermophila SB210]|uniref:Alpha/beta fold hydrolase n=1 Tax=Tetrahymena thermophila (strain SB210) TaxID=312017 RepID=Q236H8_TETTS|nr:alpha/beta fold hydrolase [Tetrahymena thermophila SB210]EAR92522.1 alpha/beta fold hydrolase [Tetrahymena thermophila SB210]|eukprot:XP_001012767.1 alpha/beta fold hydrolase [Tetrahymena thermophila SB210]
MFKAQNQFLKLSNGDTLAYSVINPDNVQTVLLIHGNMSEKNSWNRLVVELSKFPYRIIAIDQRGYGESSYINKIEKIEDLSSDLKEFCQTLQLQDLIICGWSLGGIVTLQFTAENPLLVKRAVLIASGHVEGFPLQINDVQGSSTNNDNSDNTQTRRVQSIEEVNAHPKIQYFKQIIKHQDKTTFKNICKSVLFNGLYAPNLECEELNLFAEGFLKQQNYVEIAFALSNFNIAKTNLLDRIQCPILIYHGAKDVVIPKHLALSNAEFIGKDKCKVIIKEEFGHCPPYDSPNELAQEINEFCQENLVL